MDTTYQGWKNYATWNVALWIQNDESLYSIARAEFSDVGYVAFADYLRKMVGMTETPDKIALNDSGLDIDELDKMMRDL